METIDCPNVKWQKKECPPRHALRETFDSSLRGLRSLRILEIGDRAFFYHRRPEQTTWLWTNKSRIKDEGARPEHKFTWRRALEMKRRIEAGKFDLILLTYIGIPLFRPEYSFFKNWFYLLRRMLTKFYTLAPYLLLYCKLGKTPVGVIDIWDDPVIRPQYFRFFPIVRRYFKRELPQNIWQTFLFTTRHNENLSNISKQPFLVKAGEKIRPFPWVCYDFDDFAPIASTQKTTDIFYVGSNSNPIRQCGLALLEKLRAEGWRIDIPKERLEPEEFHQRLGRAWIAWSPQGLGWQCTRHYEAIIHGAVPVINYPTIYRYHALVEGLHAFYYGCEDAHLVEVLRAALSDKERLLRMVNDGRNHLRAWYSTDAVLRYVWNEVSATD